MTKKKELPVVPFLAERIMSDNCSRPPKATPARPMMAPLKGKRVVVYVGKPRWWGI